MTFPRRVEPELLDALSPADPLAEKARRDLRLVNALMGHAAIWKRILKKAALPHTPSAIVDLGAGDGTFMLRLSRVGAWPGAKLYLVDRQPAVAGSTLGKFAESGLHAEVVEAEVNDWLDDTSPVDMILANLFLHHFSDAPLKELLRRIAQKTQVFAACEPRRSKVALAGSHLLGLIGCGPVTRYDAVVSVRAGFTGSEISALWPDKHNWRLEEYSTGLFSHGFFARRLPTLGSKHRT